MAPPLSSDIVDCVLTSLPDFATLASAILISKSFHEVFQAHPSSILTSVATTQIGPELLPCAIRLAHFNKDEYLSSRSNYVQGFPSERKFHDEAPGITSYAAALAKNDDVVTELELFFSTTCKDRTSGTRSLLNPRESLRFRRAFYRWWLLVSLFPGCVMRPTRTPGGNADDEGNDAEDSDDDDDTRDDNSDDTDDDDDADSDAPDGYLVKSRGLRKVFLSEFPDDEVAEILQIHNFMTFVSICTRNAMEFSTTQNHILLWSGPSIAAKVLRVLRSFNQPKACLMEPANWDYGNIDGFHWPGLYLYLQERNYDIYKVGSNTLDPVQDKNVILDSRVEDTEECDECHVPHLGPVLWSSSNWHLLPCALAPHELYTRLPGRLSCNSQEIQPLVADPWSYTTSVNRHISPETPDWSEGKTLCKQCVLRVVGRYALNTLRELKAQNGPQHEDCWYGYSCRTQRKPEHAAKLNHLCDPTRGDP